VIGFGGDLVKDFLPNVCGPAGNRRPFRSRSRAISALRTAMSASSGAASRRRT